MLEKFDCADIDGNLAEAIVVNSGCDLVHAFDELGLKSGVVLVLAGGAGSMQLNGLRRSLQRFFVEVLAPLAESLHAIVIDGGTDSGVMKLIGAARAEIRGTFPLVGIAAMDTVNLPDRPGKGKDTAQLEPRHSHFVFVPGENWGDESPWIARIASVLSEGLKSITIVVNGGEITLRDISFSISERRPILVLSGTGRTADRVAAGLEDENCDSEIQALVSSGLISALNVDRDSADLAGVLRGWLVD